MNRRMFSKFTSIIQHAVDAIAPPLSPQEEFIQHWKDVTTYFLESKGEKIPVEHTDIATHLEQMLVILQEEEISSDQGLYGPCLEYLLRHRLLDALYSLARTDCPLGMKQIVLSFFTKLLSRVKRPLLGHVNAHKAVQRLIKMCGEVRAGPTEQEEIQFLCTVCAQITTQPHLVNFFLESGRPGETNSSEPVTMEPTSDDKLQQEFSLVSALINLSHSEDSRVAVKSCEGLILCASLPELIPAHCLINTTGFCHELTQRLVDTYNRLPEHINPADLENMQAKWGMDIITEREDQLTFVGKRHLVSFLSWLDYCDQLCELANPIVAEALARTIHQCFLIPCFQPALVQVSEQAAISTAAYLTRCLRTVSSERLLSEFVYFMLGEERSPEMVDVKPDTLRSQLIRRCNHVSDEVCLVTLQLFDTLLQKNDEQILHNLVLRNLIHRGYYDNTAGNTSSLSLCDRGLDLSHIDIITPSKGLDPSMLSQSHIGTSTPSKGLDPSMPSHIDSSTPSKGNDTSVPSYIDTSTPSKSIESHVPSNPDDSGLEMLGTSDSPSETESSAVEGSSVSSGVDNSAVSRDYDESRSSGVVDNSGSTDHRELSGSLADSSSSDHREMSGSLADSSSSEHREMSVSLADSSSSDHREMSVSLADSSNSEHCKISGSLADSSDHHKMSGSLTDNSGNCDNKEMLSSLADSSGNCDHREMSSIIHELENVIESVTATTEGRKEEDKKVEEINKPNSDDPKNMSFNSTGGFSTIDLTPDSTPTYLGHARSQSRTEVHKVVNSFLSLLPDELKSSSQTSDSGYDMYLRDAHVMYADVLRTCKNWDYPRHVENIIPRTDTFYEGDFMHMVLDKLSHMLDQSYPVNLQLTSLVSRLALVPHPNLHEYLLDPHLPMNPGARTLFIVFQKVANEIRSQLAADPAISKQLLLVRRRLMGGATNMQRFEGQGQLEAIIVLEEFCKELSAIAIVKHHALVTEDT